MSKVKKEKTIKRFNLIGGINGTTHDVPVDSKILCVGESYITRDYMSGKQVVTCLFIEIGDKEPTAKRTFEEYFTGQPIYEVPGTTRKYIGSNDTHVQEVEGGSHGYYEDSCGHHVYERLPERT